MRMSEIFLIDKVISLIGKDSVKSENSSTCGGLANTPECLLDGFKVRCVDLGGDPRADPEHAREIRSLC